MDDVQAIAEEALIVDIADQRPATEALFSEDTLQPGLKDVDIERESISLAEIVESAEILCGDALGGGA
jgi:hypothetical protein